MIWRALAILAGLAIGTAAISKGATDDKALGYFSQAAEAPHVSQGYGATTVVGVVLLGGCGAWLLLRGRRIQLPGRVVRRLVIDETKSLGSRQYLVVASYEGKKLLLGVCPGRIDLLTPLDGSPAPEKAR
jgi:flagellar protein FliO/FliZ